MSDLVRHPVHRTLTRPQMFLGVTATFFIINMMVSTIAFLILSDWFANTLAILAFMLVPLVTHFIGYFASLREPRIFDLWITKVSKCSRIPNFRRWGCNSYAP